MEVYQGKVWKYGDNINTDIISPPASLELSIKEAAKYAMMNVDPDFGTQAKPGDMFVAEHNLGSGSSRETSPLMLKELGIRAVIAKSFARIFYRNVINVGMLAIQCEDTDKISKGDIISVDLNRQCIDNLTTKETYQISPIPAHILTLIEKGGLIPYVEYKMAGGK
jgi:3-isopropylmalate/(R)-2-methylmalate dehydratase small subunit